MDSNAMFRRNLATVLKDRGLSRRRAAPLCRVNYVHLQKVISGKVSPSLDVCDRIATGLGLTLSGMIEEPAEEKTAVSP